MDDFELVYGPWAGRTPADAAEFFADYPGVWWVAGGWAIEAYTGVSRPHDDLDPSVLSSQLPLLRRYLAGRLHAWSAAGGALRPVLPDDRPDAVDEEVLLPGGHQLWTRPDAAHPWEYDILLAPGDPDTWVYRRDPSITLPMAEAVWQRDGVNYLRPEIQLLYKAERCRPKDQQDFDTALPKLDDHGSDWLRDALVKTLPEHPWLARLDATSS